MKAALTLAIILLAIGVVTSIPKGKSHQHKHSSSSSSSSEESVENNNGDEMESTDDNTQQMTTDGPQSSTPSRVKRCARDRSTTAASSPST